MVEDEDEIPAQTAKLLTLISESAQELDSVIHDIAKKAELFNVD
jgi:hypothetical protein